MTDYIYNWLGNSWKGVNDKPIVTKNDFRELLSVMEDMDVEWVSCRVRPFERMK